MLKTTEKWRFACYGIMWAVIAVSVMVGLSTEKMLPDWTLAMAKYTITVLFFSRKVSEDHRIAPGKGKRHV